MRRLSFVFLACLAFTMIFKDPAERLMAIIKDETYGWLNTFSYKKSIDRTNVFLERENAFPVYFENLVGERGGGSREAQFKEIELMGKRVSSHRIKKSLANAWGTAHNRKYNATFNKGKIGRWKESYKPEHIAAFKERWNDVLLRWGYETDPDWDVAFLEEKSGTV